MILTLVRYWSDGKATLGKLFIDGVFECYTLEDEYRALKVPGETRIPAGSYDVGLRFSPKFSPRLGHDALWVQDVKNFQYILLHPGNSEKDTEGCILLGSGVSNATLTESRKAYFALYAKVSENARMDELQLAVVDYDRS